MAQVVGIDLTSARHHNVVLCVDALEEALDHYGAGEVFNSDDHQGSRFTLKTPWRFVKLGA
ncbi:hypothetical protein [Candidatus Sororendozoicomonas aggregata]|uniref:hypothetical protein n=1 Tax=Candidatus Sororendozoicomonas aggregata TaxID=3073239 RepID=UPI002ED02542